MDKHMTTRQGVDTQNLEQGVRLNREPPEFRQNDGKQCPFSSRI